MPLPCDSLPPRWSSTLQAQQVWFRPVQKKAFMNRLAGPLLSILLVLFLRGTACATEVKPMPKLDTFNYAIGTQTIGAAYGFTKEPRICETAKAILEMGSNTIKFHMSKDSNGRKPGSEPKISSLMELARDDPAHRQVLDMPFAYYLIWAYPFDGASWRKPISSDDRAKEYREMYEFAVYLLKTYNGTGKRFYLGHWEGDWYLHANYDPNADVPDEKIQGMVDWLTVRQKAVDDARKRTPHQDVEVYNYAEANLVKIAFEGKCCMANDVIPKVNLDYVSYSSYDTEHNPELLAKALDYLESKLQPKAGIEGKRVFIGEYGFPAENHTPEKQDEKSRQVMRTALVWGCPFILYWEMYNNEIDDAGKQRGFWLIDDKNQKQPVYHTHQKLYAEARGYIADFKKRTGRMPALDEYSRAAVRWLDARP